ncbi:transcriptional regulator, TetR family [Seinonella peptonophila]|uniref:Transcriptional regulator, TetR family n=1 Tax=Seinonella peptonophila TaxID=112248 RepID=A0A1M4X8E5_9BACL|nr:TetR/AcrR family transcriptional regulator [Seinonella peptonophila]SHE89778.1 transcriptional regulator, TetR family [Seinonella peptonophila]
MSPRNKQQLDQIKGERQEQIKQAAIKIFATKGITGTKMSMIAAEAGISVGLAYRYFKSKEELIEILVQELLEIANERLEETKFLPGTPLQQIEALTKHMFDEEHRYAFMLINQVKKAENVSENVAKQLEKFSSRSLYDKMVPIFKKGQALGQLRNGDTKKMIVWYFFVVNSLLVQQHGDEEYGMPHVDFLIQLIKHS